MTLFPNPTTGNVTILFPQNQGFDEVVIYDLEGKIVFSEQIAKNITSKSLNTSTLASGIYTVRLKGATSISQKLVKE